MNARRTGARLTDAMTVARMADEAEGRADVAMRAAYEISEIGYLMLDMAAKLDADKEEPVPGLRTFGIRLVTLASVQMSASDEGEPLSDIWTRLTGLEAPGPVPTP